MGLKGRIFVTGGTGTLGNAFLLTAERESWDAEFTIYSRDEFKQSRMKGRFKDARYIIGDVRDSERLELAMSGHDTVLHLAAMKRIPECEQFPVECILTNVMGSQNVLGAAFHNGVEHVVGVSTDKACRAITAYGASKRLMEAQFLACGNLFKVSLARYGNVISSRGSVIPTWLAQQREGLPITLTDQTMTRFWMGPLQAVQVVLEAMRADPNTITIPKLEAMSILTMAELVLDPTIKYTTTESGRRSLEKHDEDLVSVDEPVGDEDDDYFFIQDGGRLGNKYTSQMAPHLSQGAFLEMLHQSAEIEEIHQ